MGGLLCLHVAAGHKCGLRPKDVRGGCTNGGVNGGFHEDLGGGFRGDLAGGFDGEGHNGGRNGRAAGGEPLIHCPLGF